MRKIDLIVIHCSATRENKPFPVTSLIACHDSRYGFTGYHYYITRDGEVYQTRHENLVGAHARQEDVLPLDRSASSFLVKDVSLLSPVIYVQHFPTPPKQ